MLSYCPFSCLFYRRIDHRQHLVGTMVIQYRRPIETHGRAGTAALAHGRIDDQAPLIQIDAARSVGAGIDAALAQHTQAMTHRGRGMACRETLMAQDAQGPLGRSLTGRRRLSCSRRHPYE